MLVERELDILEAVGSVADLEITPVSAAIARYLNIDVSHEGHAARSRRGIAVIVHGAPLSGNLLPSTATHFSLSLTSENEALHYGLIWSLLIMRKSAVNN